MAGALIGVSGKALTCNPRSLLNTFVRPESGIPDLNNHRFVRRCQTYFQFLHPLRKIPTDQSSLLLVISAKLFKTQRREETDPKRRRRAVARSADGGRDRDRAHRRLAG